MGIWGSSACLRCLVFCFDLTPIIVSLSLRPPGSDRGKTQSWLLRRRSFLRRIELGCMEVGNNEERRGNNGRRRE